MLTKDSTIELALPSTTDVLRLPRPSEIELEVMSYFEQYRDPILRYSISFGISVHDAEEVAQEVFLALFRHLQLGRSQKNLRGWIYRVAHNLALKQRYANQQFHARTEPDEDMEQQHDPSPNPEEQLSFAQRRRRLLTVVHVLPETDQNCLRLRAEGLRYREIAAVLGISLGSVSISLTRSIERLIRSDGR